ncbi:hypothetical protein [Sphingomonas sp. AX6]|uniref:hypothetical protein n=1 Tax=Sphingomonas sp. AX6 TaxID=2653171 RepID=UPI0012F3F9F9|nr:hypothetical protein [Sphingomonas sp. AX6]VXD01845.1 hypothetical protein SPHINGOAX6_71188 [Sphingomonas sp. AX6]
MSWSESRKAFNSGTINFATCGIMIIGGANSYVRGDFGEESSEVRAKDGPEARMVLDTLLFAHAVDLFQSYLADLVLEIISKDHRSLRGRQISIGILFDSADIQTARKAAIDKYVADLGYQSIDDLSQSIEKSLGLKVLRRPLTRLRLTRFIQMRNVITHNRGMANQIYLSKSGSKRDRLGERVKIGKPLRVLKYLDHLVAEIDAEAVAKFSL